MENENIKNKFIADVENIIKEKTQQNFEYNNYFEKCSDTNKIIPILQEINKYFLQNFMIYINDNLKIYPVETEIYFSSNNFTYDTMIHNNDKQKNHFGQLYFHRAGRSDKQESLIDTSYRGGVDVCISSSDEYYLSILIRSAYIKHRNNKKAEIKSGIHQIVNTITDELEFSLENGKTSITYELSKKDENSIDTTNIFHQPRIEGNRYSDKDKFISSEDKYKFLLNSLNKGKNNEILNDIIKSGQNFYKNKQIKDFEEEKQTLY